MATLDLTFRFDELTPEGRPFAGDLPVEAVSEAVQGLIGELGYRALGPARVEGTVYKASGREIIVSGALNVRLGFDCVRCLQPFELTLTRPMEHVIIPAPKAASAPDGKDALEIDDAADEPDVHTYDGERLDLRPIVREDILLELPMNPACAEAGKDDCGALPTDKISSGVDTADTVDPRWAPLLELKKKLQS